MDTKKVVLAVLALTALGTALALSGLLPDFVTALLLIGAGCVMAYYITLNVMQSEAISDLSFLMKAGQSVSACRSSDQVVSLLEALVKHATGAETVDLFLVGGEVDPDGSNLSGSSILEEEAIRELNNRVWEHKETLLIDETGGEFEDLRTKLDLAELMAVPLQSPNQVLGVLYIYSRQTIKLKQKQQLIEKLAGYASAAICQHRSRAAEQARDMDIIKALAAAIDSLDPLFAGHSERVATAALLLGKKLGLTPEEMTTLEYSSRLHDVGKIQTIKTDINEDRLSNSEHPVLGAQLLPSGDFFDPIKAAIASHHERYDGKGYPLGLAHNDIPFLARIIAAADVYDALTRLCPPEERLDHGQAAEVIKRATGTLLDPLVVVALDEVESEIKAIYEGN